MSDVGEKLDRILGAFMESRLLLVATELGVADELADGPLAAADLARRTGANEDVLRRFLRALAVEGVFVEGPPGTFANNEVSELLRRGSVDRDVVLVFESVYRAFVDAPAVAREGGSMWERHFGEDYWTWLHRHPELASSFNRFMQAGAVARVEQVAGLPWGDETVVDVGGGNGALLLELLPRHASLRGVVFDLPEVALEAEARVREAGLADRCEVVAGSFLDAVPTGGDAYVLSKILHDWDDEHALRILRNVRAAMPPEARLVIVDHVLDEESPESAVWADIVMLALVGGRERTEREWRALLAETGFEVERAGGMLVEARAA